MHGDLCNYKTPPSARKCEGGLKIENIFVAKYPNCVSMDGLKEEGFLKWYFIICPIAFI